MAVFFNVLVVSSLFLLLLYMFVLSVYCVWRLCSSFFVASVSFCCVVVCIRVFLLLCVVWPFCFNVLVVSSLFLLLLCMIVISVYCVWRFCFPLFVAFVSFCCVVVCIRVFLLLVCCMAVFVV